ncbi:MAG: ABC transporter permease [Rhabdochlamydiaceae bacterium]
MKRFLMKKFFILLSSLFVVITLTFFLMHSIPGDPFLEDKGIPAEILDALKKHYGLDKPLFVQYLLYLKGLISFNMGPSFKYEGRLVFDIIKQSFPISLSLGIQSLFISLFLGFTLGTIAAFKENKWEDRFVMLLAVLGVSVPSFIVSTFLQYIFSMKLDLFPVARWGSFSHTILPSLSLAFLPTAFIARLTRANMIDVLKQEYIQTAKAKGLGTYSLIFKHVLLNTLIPIVGFLGPLTTSILTGSFVVEKIFGIPGLGGWFVLSVVNRDYTLIMGTTIFYSTILMLSIFVMDLLYCLIDPRIRLNVE